MVSVDAPPATTQRPLKGMFQPSFSQAGFEQGGFGADFDFGVLPEGDCVGELGGGVAVVAEVERAELEVEDLAGLAAVDADEGHAAEDLAVGQQGGDFAFDGEAVHQSDDAGFWGEERAGEGGEGVEPGGFEADEQPVDWAVRGELVGRAGDAWAGQVEVAERADKSESVGGDGVVVAAEQEADIAAGLGEAHAVVAAHRARADDRDPLRRHCSGTGGRCGVGTEQTLEAEEVQVVAGAAVDGEVGDRFADGGSEFEAVPGAGAGGDDVGALGVEVKQEVGVGGVGVEAGFGAEDLAGGVGQGVAEPGADGGFVAGVDVAVVVGGFDGFVGEVVADFDAVAEVGQAVAEVLAAALPHPDRQVAGLEAVGVAFGAQPEHHLAGDEQRQRELAQQRGGPSAGGEDQAVGGNCAVGGLDFDGGFEVVEVGGRPAFDWGVEAELRAVAGGELELGANAAFDVERAGAVLEEADQRLARGHHGEAAANFGGAERLVGDVVFAGAGERAGDEQAVGFADHQRAGPAEQLAVGRGGEFAPQFVGALDQRGRRRGLRSRPRG